MIDVTRLIERLEWFGAALRAVVSGVPMDDARWKSPDGAWSILEIVRHLLDEEIEDFRRRIRLTIETPAADWPANDPERWAVERRYNEAPLAETAAKFAEERAASVRWLRERVSIDWSVAHSHPQYGSFHAGDLLASWAAHDALHLRQIAKRLYQLTQRDAGKFSIDYAGEWKA
jgi:hypothetical protein